jgi:4-hydroxy-4-methyl-2-oxoglutarate aldolase
MISTLTRAAAQGALFVLLIGIFASAPATEPRGQAGKGANLKQDQPVSKVAPPGSDIPGGVVATKAEVEALSSQWKGERFADGRPRVSDDHLERVKKVKFAYIWEELRNRGYIYQFEGDWKILHPDQPFVGRALTAAYMPSRPDLEAHILRVGKEGKRVGRPNSWPIDMLQKGDVYVADGFGKVKDGTLIGDQLATAIFARTGTGVVFNAGARKYDGLFEIKGFNAYVKGWDPSEIKEELMIAINRPVRLGNAVVMPGDVIVAKFEGILAVPAHLLEEVVISGEVLLVRDEFSHLRLKEGRYFPGQLDSHWTAEIMADFRQWFAMRQNNPPVPIEVVEKVIYDHDPVGTGKTQGK